MFLYWINQLKKYRTKLTPFFNNIYSAIGIRRSVRKKYIIRKDKFSPQSIYFCFEDTKTFLFSSLRASLTLETAMVFPIFLFCMTAVLQYGNVMEQAARFSGALSETGKHMAVTAYLTKYGGNIDEAGEFAIGALSTAYAQNSVLKTSGDTSAVKNANLLLSSFLEDDEMIDLVLTYQIRSPIMGIKLPGSIFLQRARVRAWTGRNTASETEEGKDKAETEYVYVTATGRVYHEDLECTHLKLSVRMTDKASLESLRNNNGAIYHACEKCGAQAGDTVYITSEGNRYHSSLSCSGLKRTVKQVSKEEAGNMNACSKCGKHKK